jgi:predicted 3-demethylubiquinone-9 3-methyltransferase (glyoxalase superfamily)
MQKITPFLWFDGKAAEAAKFYAGIFKKSKIENISPMMASFELDGIKFIALNGGPQFKFTEAISFFVSSQTQREIDYFWEKLSAGGKNPGAAGSRTSSACRGKSCRQFSVNC